MNVDNLIDKVLEGTDVKLVLENATYIKFKNIELSDNSKGSYPFILYNYIETDRSLISDKDYKKFKSMLIGSHILIIGFETGNHQNFSSINKYLDSICSYAQIKDLLLLGRIWLKEKVIGFDSDTTPSKEIKLECIHGLEKLLKISILFGKYYIDISGENDFNNKVIPIYDWYKGKGTELSKYL